MVIVDVLLDFPIDFAKHFDPDFYFCFCCSCHGLLCHCAQVIVERWNDVVVMRNETAFEKVCDCGHARAMDSLMVIGTAWCENAAIGMM